MGFRREREGGEVEDGDMNERGKER